MMLQIPGGRAYNLLNLHINNVTCTEPSTVLHPVPIPSMVVVWIFLNM